MNNRLTPEEIIKKYPTWPWDDSACIEAMKEYARQERTITIMECVEVAKELELEDSAAKEGFIFHLLTLEMPKELQS